MLVQAYPCGEWEIGTHANEHPAPVRIVQVKVELVHPALLILQVRAVVAFVSNGNPAPALSGLPPLGWVWHPGSTVSRTCPADSRHLRHREVLESSHPISRIGPSASTETDRR